MAQGWKPSQEARTSLSEILIKLELLDGRERGFILSRLNALYLNKGKGKTKVKAKPQPKKQWKSQWENSTEYKEWMEYQKLLVSKGGRTASTPDETSKLDQLRLRAFRVKNDIQGKPGSTTSQENPNNLGQPGNPAIPTKSEETKEAKPLSSARNAASTANLGAFAKKQKEKSTSSTKDKPSESGGSSTGADSFEVSRPFWT